MKKSKIVIAVGLLSYLGIFSLVFSSVADIFGSKSVAAYIVIITMGPILLLLLMTHDGLDRFLRRLDGDDS